MNLLIWPKLSTRSRRALLKRVRGYGRPHNYTPKGHLLERLSRELGISKEEVLAQMWKEREYLLKAPS